MSRLTRLLLILLLSYDGGLRLAAEEEGPPSEGAAPEEEGKEENLFRDFWKDPTLNGKLHLTYRATYTGKFHEFKDYRHPFPEGVTADDLEQARQLKERRDDFADHDIDQYASLRLDDLYSSGKGSGFIQSVDAVGSFRFYKDIDGSPPGEESRNGFDRSTHRQALQLYTLFARLETMSRHLELVLGRQYAYEAEWVHFDGGTATFRGLSILKREVELSAFGGSPVKFYPRSSSDRDGIFGGHVKVLLADDTRLELSDVYYIDNSLEAELRQDLFAWGWVTVRYRQVNEDPQQVSLEGNLDRPAWSLSGNLRYVAKLGRNADDFNFDYTQSPRRSSDFRTDRHFNIGDIQPYDEVSLELRKGFLEHYGVSGGGTVHRLRERDLEDNYSTDWQEVWAGLDSSDSPWAGLTGRLTARYVHTDLPRRTLRLSEDQALDEVQDFQPGDITGDGEPSFLGFEVLLEQDFLRKVAVGSTLVLRSYDYQSNFAELENLTATSVGAYVRWRATALTQWLLSYSYDRDFDVINPDLEAVHTVRLQFLIDW